MQIPRNAPHTHMLYTLEQLYRLGVLQPIKHTDNTTTETTKKNTTESLAQDLDSVTHANQEILDLCYDFVYGSSTVDENENPEASIDSSLVTYFRKVQETVEFARRSKKQFLCGENIVAVDRESLDCMLALVKDTAENVININNENAKLRRLVSLQDKEISKNAAQTEHLTKKLCLYNDNTQNHKSLANKISTELKVREEELLLANAAKANEKKKREKAEAKSKNLDCKIAKLRKELSHATQENTRLRKDIETMTMEHNMAKNKQDVRNLQSENSKLKKELEQMTQARDARCKLEQRVKSMQNDIATEQRLVENYKTLANTLHAETVHQRETIIKHVEMITALNKENNDYKMQLTDTQMLYENERNARIVLNNKLAAAANKLKHLGAK